MVSYLLYACNSLLECLREKNLRVYAWDKKKGHKKRKEKKSMIIIVMVAYCKHVILLWYIECLGEK